MAINIQKDIIPNEMRKLENNILNEIKDVSLKFWMNLK